MGNKSNTTQMGVYQVCCKIHRLIAKNFSPPPKNEKCTTTHPARPNSDSLVRRYNAEVASGKNLAHYV